MSSKLHIQSSASSNLLFIHSNVFFISDTSFLFQTYFLLYFIGCAITVVPFFPICPPSPSTPYSLKAIPTPLFMSLGHAYKFFCYSILYTVIYTPTGYSVTTYLSFLKMSPSLKCHHYPTSPSHPPSIKTLSVSMILSLFLFA